jgi:hypothetical protein
MTSIPQQSKTMSNYNTEPIEFDPHGDVELQVGQGDEANPIIFTVCSRTLARVSPVFEKMLFGNFKESRPTTKSSDWRVKLPADKVVPLAIFLHICHGQLHRVPKTLPIEDLYDLTVLTNYYDGTQILGPWVNDWMASIEDDARESQTALAKAMWIAWEFGRKDLFMRIAHKLLLETEGPLGANDDEFQDLRMPPDIMGMFHTMARSSSEPQPLIPKTRENRYDSDKHYPSPPRNLPRHGRNTYRR